MTWQRGVATLVEIGRSWIVVRCPFCRRNHTHSKLSLGSREVIAGCHVGYNRCLSYAIPRRRSRV